MKGLIIKSISGDYTIDINGEYFICKPIGLFRHQGIVPKVGDLVSIENGKISKVHDRKNDLVRPFVSNVDKVFIMTSIVEPDLNTNLLDRIITMAEYANISIVLVFTKLDLVKNEEYKTITEYYKTLGYPVYYLPNDSDKIIDEIDGCICVVAGQSGVGKSTMINRFNPNFMIKTDEISFALNRGKHTTRHTELLKVGNGYVADTPGFGTLDLEMDALSLSQCFVEFFQTKCRFSKCLHLAEPGCNVKEKVNNDEILKSRYDNYVLFSNEIKKNKKY
ncbi:MAG: ribosome small subunit-dependent GTPase A [Bacilli bacterium]